MHRVECGITCPGSIDHQRLLLIHLRFEINQFADPSERHLCLWISSILDRTLVQSSFGSSFVTTLLSLVCSQQNKRFLCQTQQAREPGPALRWDYCQKIS